MTLLYTLIEIILPLQNPVLIFSLILFIILFAPLLLNKLRIPQIVGLIIAGAVVGPHGFNLLMRDSSVELFGTVGLLYIMLIAGLELDLVDFKKNARKSIIFGLYTFSIPMVIGFVAGYYLLDYSLMTSLLLASLFASHTLIAYPIVSKLGVSQNRAVGITVGGTAITDTLALLVLAIIVGMSTGELQEHFWIKLTVSVLVFGFIVLYLFPIIGRWFLKRIEDNVSQYIFVLAMVFLAGFLAEAAGIEAIIGAFLAGIALNKLIPSTSPLMNRIEFGGNALFIPFFLIGVGMLIDFKAFIVDYRTILVAVVMTVVAMLAKYLAAVAAQKTFKFNVNERNLIFALSNAQAAATLAAVLIGYNIIIDTAADGTPVRLLDDRILNGSIMMILVTCTVSSLVAQKASTLLYIEESVKEDVEEKKELVDKILIPVSVPETVDNLVDLAITIKSPKSKEGLVALHVIDNKEKGELEKEKRGFKILEKASKTASATDNELTPLLRYDIDIINGIISVVKEHKISDVIMGLHRFKTLSDKLLGKLTEGILSQSDTTTFIYKAMQPLSTIKRHIVLIPDRGDEEPGFPLWLRRVWNIASNTGAKMVFYVNGKIKDYLLGINESEPIDIAFVDFNDMEDFLVISREVKSDDNFMIVMSRPGEVSYNPVMFKIPGYLNKYFSALNYMLIYNRPLLNDPNSSNLGNDLTFKSQDGDAKVNRSNESLLSRLLRR